MTVKMQKNSLKKRFKRFLRSPKIIKIRRKLRSLQKKISPLSARGKLEKSVEHDLQAIFVGSKKPRKFMNLGRMIAFVILFMGAGGSYLWFTVTNQYTSTKPVENKGEAFREKSGITDEVKITKLVDKSEVKPKTSLETTTFTLQPYTTPSSSLSLIRTINPHFFIQAAEKQQLKVAVLIVGVGTNQSLTDEIIEEAPKNVSLIFSPYTSLLQEAIESAQMEGFTVLVSIPLEDEDPVTDQGYLTIMSKADEEKNQESLKNIALNSQGVDCFYGQGGARLLRSESALQPVFSYIKQVNNCFVAPPDILVNRLHEVAAKINLNYVCTTIENPSEDLIVAVEALAKRTGFAIIAFDAKPGVLGEIKQWIKNLEQAKLSVVPITEIIHP